MVLNAYFLFILLFLLILLSLVVFVVISFSVSKKSRIVIRYISGFTCGILVILFISLGSTLLNSETRLLESKPIEKHTYEVQEITKDYIVYGSDFLNTYKLWFFGNNQENIVLHKVEEIEDIRIELESTNFIQKWLINGLYIKDKHTTYNVYVEEDVYNVLIMDYVLFDGGNE